MYRILFFGTSPFAVPSLAALLRDGRFDIVGVVTQPDRPVGRKQVMTAPPVKAWSIEHRAMNIRQPEKLKDDDFQSWIREIGPTCDAFVVVSYGKILPQWLLDLPKSSVINVHGSLLPRWRGASPIQAAIAAGDDVSGVTIMRMDADLDHGPIIEQAEERILPEDTCGSLHDRLAELGARILPQALVDVLSGAIVPSEQEHELATACRTLTREDGKIDWTKPAEEIERLVRAYDPWPGTWTEVEGKRIKINNVRIAPSDATRTPGERFISKEIPFIACGNGTVLEVLGLQYEGSRPTTGDAYLRGRGVWA